MKLNLFMCFFFLFCFWNTLERFPLYSPILLTLWFRYLKTCVCLVNFSSKLPMKHQNSKKNPWSFFFFQFFEILIFWVVGRVKGQKVVQNDKKFCLSCFICFNHVHNMIVIYDTHMCKMIISPVSFFIFSKFWFFMFLGGKSAKNGPKWHKICLVHSIISRTIHHMTVIYGTHL